jgi:ribonuclease BN (tRNA processing enzyme)
VVTALRVTVLGCSGSYPGPGAACSGYLLQGGGVNVALDLGPGSLANLQRHLDLRDLDAVVLSHGHPDHWIDLTGLEVALTYALRREGLPVYGTAHNRGKVEALLDGTEPAFAWTDVGDGDHVRIGGLDVDFSATDHYIDTRAVRVATTGGVFAYSADTGPGWSFSEFEGAHGLDLALCEATNLASAEGDGVLHLSARQAGAMARDAGAERLVLTHVFPGIDLADTRCEGQAAFGRPIEVARVDATYEL